MPKRSRSGVVSRPGARRRADQRERRQVERDDARAGALADRDRQPAVLHRRVERLLERARQAVDLVDEEHAARLERREEGGDVALALERRAGGLHERDVELGRDDLRQRGLAEARAGRPAARGRAPRRARARPRSRPRAARCSASWPTNSSRRRGRSERSSSSSATRYGRLDAAVRRRSSARRSRAGPPCSACGDQLLGAVARRARVEQRVGLLRASSRARQAVAGEHARVVAARRDRDRRRPSAARRRRPSRAARR